MKESRKICFIYCGSMELTLELIGKSTIEDLLNQVISEMNLPNSLPPKSYLIHSESGVSVPLDSTFEFFNEEHTRLFLNHDSHYWHVEYTPQEDANGCAAACLAMVTGNEYSYVKAFFSGRDLANSGITWHGYNEFLLEQGYSINWKWHITQAEGTNKKRDIWPASPWADIHIVVVTQHSGISHAVVMLGDGTILDPLNKDIKSFDSYKEVTQMIGIHKV